MGLTGKIFLNVHGQMQNVHGHFYEIVHGHFFEVHGKKKNTASSGSKPIRVLTSTKSLATVSDLKNFFAPSPPAKPGRKVFDTVGGGGASPPSLPHPPLGEIVPKGLLTQKKA